MSHLFQFSPAPRHNITLTWGFVIFTLHQPAHHYPAAVAEYTNVMLHNDIMPDCCTTFTGLQASLQGTPRTTAGTNAHTCITLTSVLSSRLISCLKPFVFSHCYNCSRAGPLALVGVQTVALVTSCHESHSAHWRLLTQIRLLLE